ncbi:MAG: major capsid protein E [Bacteriophage sp.]|nr:MAG: major capsid protein E [Bacteriophage sp.]
MRSIYSTFTGLHNVEGKPLDFLAAWKKTFDKASEREVILFQKMYSDEYLEYEAPQLSLTAEGLMGKYHFRVMATVLANESPTPLRRSDGFDLWTKEIPRVGHKFFMKVSTYRKLLEVYKSPYLKEPQKVKQIEKTLKNDMQNSYLGCKDYVDYVLLTALSNWGVCRFKPELNNPGGREFEVDYMMEDANKLVSALLWSKANSKAGKLDITLLLTQIVTLFKAKGITFKEMMMAPELISFMRMDEGIRTAIFGNDKKAKIAKLTELNEYLSENELPPVKEIKRLVAIEKDGEAEPNDPWNHNMIVFIPESENGKLGVVQPSIEDSELMEEENVDYMDAGNGIRISKWRTGDSTGQQTGEYTQGAARLLPVITEINAVVALQVRGFEEKASLVANADDKMFNALAVYEAAGEVLEG